MTQHADNSGNAGRARLDPDYQRNWPMYYQAVSGKPPRDTAIRALNLFAMDGAGTRSAIDIACGEGRDTRAILAAGPWHVTAIDYHDEAIKRTLSQLSAADAARCRVVKIAMEAIATNALLQEPVDFVNASFAIPFCEPAAFPGLWAWIQRILKPGGRFAGQFFGDRDDWCVVRPGSHLTRPQLEELLGEFEVEYLDEVEKDGDDAMGGTKHHHLYHVVARTREGVRG